MALISVVKNTADSFRCPTAHLIRVIIKGRSNQ